VGSFFIPIGNIFFIFGTFKDLLTGLGKFFPVINSERQKSMKIWWIVSVIGGLFSNTSGATITEDSNIDEIMTAAGIEIASALVIVIGLVFGVKAFKQLRDDTKPV
jgi:ABC-type thiamin/hydroxymethylpyrimidine transport system permease subunit